MPAIIAMRYRRRIGACPGCVSLQRRTFRGDIQASNCPRWAAISRHEPTFFDHDVSATNGPLNSDESVFALHASSDVPKLHSAPLGFAIKSSNLTFRAGAVTSRSTPKANSKAFDLSQGSEKRRVEIGYAPRIHAGHSLSSI